MHLRFLLTADPTGLEPAISGVTGRRVGRYTTGPQMLWLLARLMARTTETVPYGYLGVNSLLLLFCMRLRASP